MVTAAALPSTAAPLFFSRCLCACLTQSLDSIMGVVFDRYAAAELHRVAHIDQRQTSFSYFMLYFNFKNHTANHASNIMAA
jgi:hypothetical protein